ncbi:hypothetical protein M422DRAFT_272085 [Sphaerobolus stellatus SS14]|uniref:Uncharacterized protein n=1 Tax=Sphaerobolus stellatus (strain SS14) TaxID=990650 RepID=A0A0C9UCE0_SPHS4|nr:hypothetical protein M422DRAFT_272085 [Sphaerobolus stellatus SS14]
MSTCRNCKQAEEPSAPAVGENEPLQGLTAGELTDPSPSSVDPQQSSEVFAQDHPGDPSARAHSPQTVPVWVQSPIGTASAASTSAPSQCLFSDSEHNLSGAPDESDRTSPDEGGMENEDGSFTIKASELSKLQKEYVDLMNLKENSEIVLVEAMEATKWLNTQKSSGKTIEPRNNWTHSKAAAKAATKQIVTQGATNVPVTGTQQEEHEIEALDTNAQYWSNLSNKAAHHSCRALELQLNTNAQYWSNLSNKAAHHSCRALELQLKMAEEKVNILLYEEAPEEVLLEAAREVCHIHFQLDQNTCLREAGLMPEQQVRFRTDIGRSVNNPSREYGINPIHEATPALSMTAQLDSAVVNRTAEYRGIQQMVRQAVQNVSHEAEPEKSFLAKAGVKMRNPPLTVMNATSRSKVQLQFLGQCLTDEAQEWFYWQKWFMLTLSMNKVAVNYNSIMQGSMTVQQLHQKLSKLAKQMIELPDVYSYRRRFMNALKTDIRDQVLRKGFMSEFSSIDELVDEAVRFDNAKRYTSDYNSNHGSSYLHKAANAENSCAQHTPTQNKSSTNQNAGSSNQHKSGNKPIQSCQTTPLLLKEGGNVRINLTYGKNPVKQGNTVNRPTQSNPIRTALKANNTVVCFNYNQLGHMRPNCPFPDKNKRVAGARIEEVILEEDEGQIEEFDKGAPHPEEQQDWDDQPEEDDQQYHFDDEEYETRSIDEEFVHVNAVVKASGYHDCHRFYRIRVQEAVTGLRVSAAVQTGGKEQPVYDH